MQTAKHCTPIPDCSRAFYYGSTMFGMQEATFDILTDNKLQLVIFSIFEEIGKGDPLFGLIAVGIHPIFSH